jgi:predicted MFS family arabinose efflux permease
LFAVITSLAISSATRGIDRRHLLLSLTGLMIASGLMVALALIASEFMPVSLLTPIARDLHITEGHAVPTQSVSAKTALHPDVRDAGTPRSAAAWIVIGDLG